MGGKTGQPVPGSRLGGLALMPSYFILFDQTLTRLQLQDTHRSLGLGRIVAPSPNIQETLSHVPQGAKYCSPG
jgi:sensor histidine kinase regulating citrate/malate metabolism